MLNTLVFRRFYSNSLIPLALHKHINSILLRKWLLVIEAESNKDSQRGTEKRFRAATKRCNVEASEALFNTRLLLAQKWTTVAALYSHFETYAYTTMCFALKYLWFRKEKIRMRNTWYEWNPSAVRLGAALWIKTLFASKFSGEITRTL